MAALYAPILHRILAGGRRQAPYGCNLDIMTGYTLALASHRGMVGDDYPDCRAYVARLGDRPGYQAARAAG